MVNFARDTFQLNKYTQQNNRITTWHHLFRWNIDPAEKWTKQNK